LYFYLFSGLSFSEETQGVSPASSSPEETSDNSTQSQDTSQDTSQATATDTDTDNSQAAEQPSENPVTINGGEGDPLANVLPYTSSTKINVDPSSGSASTSFPISVSAGRAGIQPSLALFYNSSLKNGPFGMGWNLGLGDIEISTKKGPPKYDSSDHFVLNQGGGNEELIWDETAKFYRAKIEGSFRKTERVSDYWVVTDKKGIKYYFGQTHASRQYDSTDSTKIFKWYLDKVEDLFGNTMTIEYTEDQNQIYPSKILYTGNSKQRLLPYAEVNFQYEDRPDKSSTMIPGFEVKTARRLQYIEVFAADQLQQKYHLIYTTSQATQRSLLKEIVVYGADGGTLPSTIFTYQNEDNPSLGNYSFSSKTESLNGDDVLWNYQQNGQGTIYTEPSGLIGGTSWETDIFGHLLFSSNAGTVNTFWTYLYATSARIINVPFTDGNNGHDNEGNIYIWVNDIERTGNDRYYWPLKEGWNSVVITGVKPEHGFTFKLQSELTYEYNGYGHADLMDSAGLGLVPLLGGDFDGDGLADTGSFLRREGTVKIKLATLNGFGPETVWIPNFGKKLEIVPGDFNGDGKTDIASFDRKTGKWNVAISDGAQFNGPKEWLGDSRVGPEVYGPNAADINADGLTDVLIFYKESQLIKVDILLNQGGSFALMYPRWTPSIGPDSGTPFTADFNGDGLPDFANVDKDSGYWVFYLHPGRMGADFIEAPSVYNFGNGQQAVIADFNADGFTDIGYYEKSSGKVFYRISQGGYSFDAGVQNLPFNFSANQQAIQVQASDYNGDGVTDFASSDSIQLAETAFSNNGKTSDLLFETKNGIGGTTELVYTSSCFNEDPLRSMPFCIPVVSSVVVKNDRNSNDHYETKYEYTKGLWDWDDREFRGFGKVKIIDIDDNYSETTFEQEDDYKKGRPLEQASYAAGNPNPYTKTVNAWETKDVTSDGKSKFVFLKRSDQYLCEGDVTCKHTAAESKESDYDTYGNVTHIRQLGEVVDGNDITGDERTVETQYHNNTSAWLLGLPKETIVKDSAGQEVRKAWFYYDDSNDLEAQPTKGQLTKKEDWAGEGNINPVTRYSYDNYGNLETTTDPLGNTTTITYDTTYHLFPITTTNALLQTVNNTYYGVEGVSVIGLEGKPVPWGLLKSTTDPNGQTVQKDYDVFGRSTIIVSPLDSVQFPTSRTEYTFFSNYIKVKTSARIEHGRPETIDSVQYVDGLGRPIETKTRHEDPDQYIVSGRVEYDNRGLVKRGYLPFFTTEPLDILTAAFGPYYSENTYDSMGRVVKTTNPDGTSSQVKYNDWAVTSLNENGNQQRSESDAYGRLVLRKEYKGVYAQPEESAPVYAATQYQYDSEGNLTKVIDAHLNETTITYDNLGRKTEMVDPDMGHWSYKYDLIGNLTEQIDAKGQVLRFDYDVLNRLRNKRDEQVMNVDYVYDDAEVSYSRGRLTQAIYQQEPLGMSASGNDFPDYTQFMYDALGREIASIKVIDDQQYPVQRQYDALNRLKSMLYPDNSSVLFYSYNAAGQIETVSDTYIPNEDPPSPATGTVLLIHADWEEGLQYFVDATGRHIISPQGDVYIDTQEKVAGTGSARFDGDGDYLLIPDSDDWYFGTKDFKIDFWVQFNTIGDNYQTIYYQGISINSNYIWLYKNSDNGIQFECAVGGKLISNFYTDANTVAVNTWYHIKVQRDGEKEYIYINDIDGQPGEPRHLNYSVDPDANTNYPDIANDVNIGWDIFFWDSLLNGWIDELRIKVVDQPAQINTEDPVTYVKNVDYNAAGQMMKIEYGNGVVTTYEYNELTLRLTRLLTVNSSLLTVQDLNYTYDNVGNIKTITDAARGMNQTFTYDELNRLKTATGKYCDEGSRECLKEYSYDEVGNIDTIIDDGVTKDYTYGENAGPHAVTLITKNSDVWLNFEYDANGNMIEQEENSVVTQYTYDTENRLIKVTKDAVPVAQYVYDGDGGRVKKIVFKENALQQKGGGVKFNFERYVRGQEASRIDRSFSNNPAGDAIGGTEILPPDPSTRTGSAHGLAQDSAQRADQMESQALPAGLHSSEGWKPGSPSRGTEEHFNGEIETTKYVGSLYEVQGTRQIRYIFFGNQRIASVDSQGKTSYFLTDHLGSTNLIVDDTGALKEWTEYEPFGSMTTHEMYGGDEDEANFYFGGKEFDSESGLIFFGARYYMPLIGRFITPDTIVPYASDPQSLNRYSYARNNPINFIDPDGHFFWFAALVFIAKMAVVGAIAGGIIGGVMGGIMAGINGTSVMAGIGAGILSGAISGAAGGATFGTGMVGAVGLGILSATSSAAAVNATVFILSVASGAVGGGAGSVSQGGSFASGAITGAITAGVTAGIGMSPVGAKLGDAISKTAIGKIFQSVNGWVSSSFNEMYYSINTMPIGSMRNTPNTALNVDKGSLASDKQALNIESSKGDFTQQTTIESQTKSFYRAMSPAEYDDLMTTGQFRPGEGTIEGKFFATTPQDAQAWGQKFYPSGDYRIVEIQVSQTKASTFLYWNRLDGIGPAAYSDVHQLQQVNIRTIK